VTDSVIEFPGSRFSSNCRSNKLHIPPPVTRLCSPKTSFYLLIILLFLCQVSPGRAADYDTTYYRLTHAEFISRSLAELVGEILAGVPSDRQADARLAPLDGGSGHTRLAESFASVIHAADSAGPIVYYQVYRDEFLLVEKKRWTPLGSFWVLREFNFGVTIVYPPEWTPPGKARIDFERTYTGWVRSADLSSLAGDEFGSLSAPPAADFVSRWLAPVAVAGCLGALTYLFFSVR